MKFGGPDGLAIVDLPDLTPARGQVLISVEAAGVGSVDVMIRSGALAAFGFKEGYVPGNEVAGTVVGVGDGVDRSWAGQRVWAFTGTGGGYAEQVMAPVEAIVPLPETMPAVDAVTLGSSGIVAHFGLRRARFTAGESVLIRGAAGGIGVMVVQLAVRSGANVVAVTTSSKERGDRLAALGATHVLSREGAGGADAPAGYDVIMDIVGGADLASYFDRLNPNGRMVALGAVAGFPPPDFAGAMYPAFQKSLSFATFSAASIPLTERQQLVAELFAAACLGELQAVVDDVLPLEQAVQAHRIMEGSVFGRLALTVTDS